MARPISGKVETSKVHLLREQGGHLVTRCGTERKFYGFETGEPVTCKSCRSYYPQDAAFFDKLSAKGKGIRFAATGSDIRAKLRGRIDDKFLRDSEQADQLSARANTKAEHLKAGEAHDRAWETLKGVPNEGYLRLNMAVKELKDYHWTMSAKEAWDARLALSRLTHPKGQPPMNPTSTRLSDAILDGVARGLLQ